MIKICHMTEALNIGGLERTVEEIVTNMNSGYEHQVWCLIEKGVIGDRIERAGITVKSFGIRGSIKFVHLLRLAKELKKEKFDIIHNHGWFSSISGTIAAVFARIPVRISHCQNICCDATLKERIKLKLASFFIHKVIAVSEAVKKSLIEFVGVSSEKIEVIYNAAKRVNSASDEEKEKIRSELAVRGSDFIIGNISRLVTHKGHCYLLEAVSNIKAAGPSIRCLIIGDGPEMDRLKKKTESLNITDNVIFTGFRSDIGNLLSVMDIFILPSVLKEGLPLALAEASSIGIPLIATSVGGNSEIVFDRVNGFIIKPKNSREVSGRIKYFIDNPNEKVRMGNEAKRIWEERFSLSEALEKIGKLYRQSQ